MPAAHKTLLLPALLSALVALLVLAAPAPAASAAEGARPKVLLAPTAVHPRAVTFRFDGVVRRRVAAVRAVCPHRRVVRLSKRRVQVAVRRGRLRLYPRPCRTRKSSRGGWRLALRRGDVRRVRHSQRQPAPPQQAAPAQASPVVFADGFDGPDALITNHYARWTDDPLAARSPNWEMDSGSMFRHGGTAWTGRPTCNLPNRTASNGSGSTIFRAHLTESDLPADYRVGFQLLNNGFTEGCADRPAADWNGVKIYLRRTDTGSFYTAEVSLRDGMAYIQKKIGDEYHILAQEPGHPALIGAWESVGGSVRTNADGSVTVQVVRAGQVVLEATDRGAGGPPIVAPGRTGFRGDNTDFAIDDFTVVALTG